MFCACCEIDDKATTVEVAAIPVVEEVKMPAEKKVDTIKEEEPAAAPPFGLFSVELEMSGARAGGLGLELDAIDPKGLLVVTIAPGLIQDFNAKNPALALKPFDRIQAVNGESAEPAKLYEAMTSSAESTSAGSLKLEICRPRAFSAKIVKTGEPLGTQLNFKVSSAGIVVTRVSPGGLISKWNETNPGSEILPGDRVGALNGNALKGGAMVEGLKKESEVNLTVYRY
mmetsp:Transcript_33026/g.61911  ORF Transcript_33026/g.61911 Transcript_33026/m.61911 type:complete len:228 (+) Transcript_33026:50-733(+)